MKIARILWNLMAGIGILVTLVYMGNQAIDIATSILTTLQQIGQ